MACPTLEDIVDLQQGNLDGTRSAEIKAHFSMGCSTCSENYRFVQNVLDLTVRDDSFDFPEDTIQWTINQFKAAGATAPWQRQFLAQRIFDSFSPVRLAAVRSSPTRSLMSRQVLFRAGDYDIDIRLEATERDTSLQWIGQILHKQNGPGGVDGLGVRLVRLPEPAGPMSDLQTATDSRGMFRLTDVPAGEYDLEIRVPEGEVRVRRIHATLRYEE